MQLRLVDSITDPQQKLEFVRPAFRRTKVECESLCSQITSIANSKFDISAQTIQYYDEQLSALEQQVTKFNEIAAMQPSA